MIPSNITKDHLLIAIENIDKHGYNRKRDSTSYSVRYNGNLYPPKVVISLANKYANGIELDRNRFHGGYEANTFLVSKGFEITDSYGQLINNITHDFAPRLKDYIEKTYSIKSAKGPGRSRLSFSSGSILHIRGSTLLDRSRGFYYLQEEDYKDIIANKSGYLAIVFGSIENTFVFGKKVLEKIFHGVPLAHQRNNKGKWYFDIRKDENSRYLLKIHSNEAEEQEVSRYLNSWEQIPEFQDKNGVHATEIYITAYDNKNLEISKKLGILGWKDKPSKLSVDDLVFLYDTDNHIIDSCFKIVSVSDNKEPIWHDEVKKGVLYEYRWNAKLVSGNMQLSIDSIHELPPFKGNKRQFSLLIRGTVPRLLHLPQYDKFIELLINISQKSKFTGYWIFVVIDQPKHGLTAREIFTIRMKDNFWGLTDKITYRPNILKGDKIILSIGGKEFVGSVTLDSDSFKLSEEEKSQLSHNNEFFRTEYGVNLRDIEVWTEPKPVERFLDRLSFIQRREYFPAYFQGGIKRITSEDFELITKLNHVSISSEYPKSLFSLTGNIIENIISNILGGTFSGKLNILEIERDTVRRVINHLISGKHVILVGPPGTGKTDLARRLLIELGFTLNRKTNPVEAVASYEWGRYDVIGGNSLKPDPSTNEFTFHLGCVTKAIKENSFLLIDEFNRADMNKAFGEMFLGIDHGRIELREDERPDDLLVPYSNHINIPSEFRMICTMNDYDKSLLNELSYGLLRRFAFVEVDIPKDKKKLMNVIKHRIYSDLSLVDNARLEKAIAQSDYVLSKLIDFIYDIYQKRKLGVSTLIDSYRYIIIGIITRIEPNKWNLLNESLIDYIIPQIDRLDIDTLKHIKDRIQNNFSDEDDANKIRSELEGVIDKLNEAITKLEDLGSIFDKR